jgi:polygalacturonase
MQTHSVRCHFSFSRDWSLVTQILNTTQSTYAFSTTIFNVDKFVALDNLNLQMCTRLTGAVAPRSTMNSLKRLRLASGRTTWYDMCVPLEGDRENVGR